MTSWFPSKGLIYFQLDKARVVYFLFTPPEIEQYSGERPTYNNFNYDQPLSHTFKNQCTIPWNILLVARVAQFAQGPWFDYQIRDMYYNQDHTVRCETWLIYSPEITLAVHQDIKELINKYQYVHEYPSKFNNN